MFFDLKKKPVKLRRVYNLATPPKKNIEDNNDIRNYNSSCSACPNSSKKNVESYNKETDNSSKYIKKYILDENIALQNKYTKNFVNLNSDIDNISNNVQQILVNHYIK